MDFLVNLNLNKHEIQNAVVQPLATAPTNPVLGQIYFNSSTKKLMQFDGTNWVTVGMAVESSSTNGNIKVDGTDITVYTLPTAASDTLGGVKVGSKLSITNDGTLSADAQAWTDITGKPSNIVTDASYVHTDNNFTNTLKSKLDGIASGAEVNVNADWNASTGDAQILNKPTIDSAPTSGHSDNLVSSGGVYTAIQNAISDATELFECTYGTTTASQIKTAFDEGKVCYCIYGSRTYYLQELTSTPKADFFTVDDNVVYTLSCSGSTWTNSSITLAQSSDLSSYLAKSGGTMTGALTLSGAPTSNLEAATKKYVDDGLANKQNTLTFDDTPTASSDNPVTSGGVYTAIPRNTSDLNNDSGFITSSDIPEGAAASTTSPKMDGTAAVGTEMAFARGDHRHPTDTSRAPLASPTFTGVPAAPTATTGTNTTQIATTAFVQTAIGNLALITITVVETLPSTGQSNVIYLVPKSTSQTNNAYDEYIWVTSTTSFEKIGDTQIDLSNYLQTTGNASSTTVTFTAAGSRALPATGETLATIIGKATKYFTDLSTVAFSGSYADLSNKPTLPSVDTATMTTSQTSKAITATGSTVVNVQVVDSVTHEVVITDVSINGKSVTVSVASAPTNALTITVLSI